MEDDIIQKTQNKNQYKPTNNWKWDYSGLQIMVRTQFDENETKIIAWRKQVNFPSHSWFGVACYLNELERW